MEGIGLHERALLRRFLSGSSRVPGLRQIPGVTVLLDHDDLAASKLKAHQLPFREEVRDGCSQTSGAQESGKDTREATSL
jgi:hypothetical protein